jgi:hypothetical protein
MLKKISVMLAVPTMTNRITIQIAGFLDALRQQARDPDTNAEVHFMLEMGRSPVELARNVLCGHFLQSHCDALWFIDEDMMPEGSAARLLRSAADITCARMYKFDHPNSKEGRDVGLGLCAFDRTGTLYRPLNPEIGSPSIQECDAVGTGCTIIKRHVIEDRRLWRDNTYTDRNGNVVDGNVMIPGADFAPNIFKTHRAPNGHGITGEDIDFCERAKHLGYSIAVDLNAVCGHFKSIDIDQAGFLAQQTVKRVFAGMQLDGGEVLKADSMGNIKRFDGPPADKSVRVGDFAAKAL